jgi:hypothetical protein
MSPLHSTYLGAQQLLAVRVQLLLPRVHVCGVRELFLRAHEGVRAQLAQLVVPITGASSCQRHQLPSSFTYCRSKP